MLHRRNISSIVMAFKPILTLSLFIVAGACQSTGYRYIPSQPADESYNVSPFGMTSEGYDNHTCTATIHTKFFEDAGFLAICGFILNAGEIGCSSGYLGQKLTDAVFEDATLRINGEDVSRAGFYTIRDFGTTVHNVRPTCIRTDKIWRGSYAYERAVFKYPEFTQVSE